MQDLPALIRRFFAPVASPVSHRYTCNRQQPHTARAEPAGHPNNIVKYTRPGRVPGLTSSVQSLAAPVIKKQPPEHIHSSSPPAVTRMQITINSTSHSCHISRLPFRHSDHRAFTVSRNFICRHFHTLPDRDGSAIPVNGMTTAPGNNTRAGSKI